MATLGVVQWSEGDAIRLKVPLATGRPAFKPHRIEPNERKESKENAQLIS
jgi:hypothetical protein